MLAVTTGVFSQNVFTSTLNGNDVPNLSVEFYSGKVITGYTERGNSGFLSPTFHITDASGTTLDAFHLEFLHDPVYLMDFTINTSSQTILLTGMTAATDPVTPHKMFVAEVDFTGTLLQSYIHYETSGISNMIPHKIIYSASENQVVVVGSKIDGLITNNNYSTLNKQGFILGLRPNLNQVLFRKSTNSTTSGSTDYDMLENITEVPHMGYFISGSANNSTGMTNEQNLAVLNIDYTGAIIHSDIHDMTNAWMAGSSVLFVNDINQVYVLCNTSSEHTFLIARFNPTTALINGQWWRHDINSLNVGSEVNVNGFDLENMSHENILVSGYIDLFPSSVILPSDLTPYQMMLSMDLSTMVNGKYYGSDNNAPMAGYFSEAGSSVFINTPDIGVYDSGNRQSFLVNQNTTSVGYDLLIDDPTTATGPCATQFEVMSTSLPTVVVGSLTYSNFSGYPTAHTPVVNTFRTDQSVSCSDRSVNHALHTAMLSPNPANEYLTIENETGIKNVTLYDLKGNVVKDLPNIEMTRSGARVYIGKLTTGLYVIEITDSEGNQIRERLVKE